MRTKLLTIAAATVVVVSANTIQYHHKNNDDPNNRRRISPAETISKRSKNNNRLRLRSLRGLKQRNDGADNNNNIISSSSEQLEGGGEERALNTLDDIISSSSSSSEVAPELKIIGGIPATTDRYPYLVSLTYFGTSICGGSLVAPDMVLTAAHCAGYASAIERGRTDRSVPFNTAKDNFERIEVAYEIKHPGWDVTTVDNDFMLIKLVTNSISGSLVTLNTDPNVPNLPKEQLTIMGWGDTNSDPDVNEPGISLLQANVEYVPNDTCRAKEGVIGTGDFVKYESRLTPNMMCAMDEDGERGDGSDVVDEDTCVGDSGGPMIIPPNSGSNGLDEDLQVGLVSWGIGCASPIFPGVYARISAQYEWIRRNICRHSNNAPEVYDCDSLGDLDDESGTGVGGGGFPLIEEDPNDDKSYVILEVSLDDRPQEFSWMVSTLSGPTSQLVSTIPPNFYTGYTNYTFHHKLQVNPDSFYRISLRDTFGDGFNGYAAVYRGSIPILSNLIMYEDMFYDADGGTDLKRLDHAFYTGKEPQNFFTLAIKFDKFPKDTWWKLESTTDNVILAQRPPGWYNERFELMSIVEEIPVFGARPDGVDPEYRFTIGDSYPCDNNPTETCGDGICCNYGEGKFELFAGPIEDNLLLTSGGEYELTQSVLVNAPASFSVQ